MKTALLIAFALIMLGGLWKSLIAPWLYSAIKKIIKAAETVLEILNSSDVEFLAETEIYKSLRTTQKIRPFVFRAMCSVLLQEGYVERLSKKNPDSSSSSKLAHSYKIRPFARSRWESEMGEYFQ